MEKQNKNVVSNKDAPTKRRGTAYAVKRFKEAVETISQTDLISGIEKDEIRNLANKVALRYLGME